jgi:thiol:disulfide interchange protein DsbC
MIRMLFLSGLMFMSSMVWASDHNMAINNIKQSLKHIIPNSKTAQIKETPIKGLYQVIIDSQLVYMSSNGRYLMSGKLLDLKTRVNLTEKAKVIVIKKALASLSPKSMIVYPAKGHQKHSITVFSDIDCPYCEKFHREVPALNKAGIEVRYMAYPRAGIGSSSYDKAVSVWCSANPQKALNKAMLTGKVDSKTCVNPVKSDFELGAKFNVTGTPTIIFDSGDVLPGYVPAKQLIAAIKSSEK